MLATMPTRKRTAGTTPHPEVAAPKKPNRSGKPVNVWLPLELHAALDKFRAAQRVPPAITDVVELAIQEFLHREGFWNSGDAQREDRG